MNKLVEVSERRLLVGRSHIQNAASFINSFNYYIYIYRLLYNFLIIIFIIIYHTSKLRIG